MRGERSRTLDLDPGCLAQMTLNLPHVDGAEGAFGREAPVVKAESTSGTSRKSLPGTER